MRNSAQHATGLHEISRLYWICARLPGSVKLVVVHKNKNKKTWEGAREETYSHSTAGLGSKVPIVAAL